MQHDEGKHASEEREASPESPSSARAAHLEGNTNSSEEIRKLLERFIHRFGDEPVSPAEPYSPDQHKRLIALLGGKVTSEAQDAACKHRDAFIKEALALLLKHRSADMKSSGWNTVFGAVYWLRELAGKNTAAALEEIIYDPQTSDDVRSGICDVLAAIGDERNAEIARWCYANSRFEEEWRRNSYLVRLVDLGEESARVQVEQLLSSDDPCRHFFNNGGVENARRAIEKYDIIKSANEEKSKKLMEMIGSDDPLRYEWALECAARQNAQSLLPELGEELRNLRARSKDYVQPGKATSLDYTRRNTEEEKLLLEGKKIEDKRREYALLNAIYRLGGELTERELKQLQVLGLAPAEESAK